MHRVIVVDDESPAVKALERLLRLDGYEVRGFELADAARNALVTEPFDAVVTDLEMPVVHGVEIVRTARRLRPGAPIFVVSAYAGSPASQAAIDAGATAVFGKPLDYDTLAAKLAEALGA